MGEEEDAAAAGVLHQPFKGIDCGTQARGKEPCNIDKDSFSYLAVSPQGVAAASVNRQRRRSGS